MELAAIRAKIRAEPSRPLPLRLVDGREYETPTPAHLYVPPKSAAPVSHAQSVAFIDASGGGG